MLNLVSLKRMLRPEVTIIVQEQATCYVLEGGAIEELTWNRIQELNRVNTSAENYQFEEANTTIPEEDPEGTLNGNADNSANDEVPA